MIALIKKYISKNQVSEALKNSFQQTDRLIEANVYILIKIQFSKEPLKNNFNMPNISRISKECIKFKKT